MIRIIIGTICYLILGVAYAIDFFCLSYEETIEDGGMQVGEFFVLAVLTGLIWPACIIIFAIMDLFGEER